MFRLRIEGGARAGETLALVPGKTYVIGRARETDFRFPEDATMSRAHAEIVPDAAGGWLLRNKSQHGSLVGPQKVDADRKLAPGDVLTLGGTFLVFEVDPTGGAGPADQPTRPPARPGAPPPLPPSGEPKTPPPMPRPAPATAAAMPAGGSGAKPGAAPTPGAPAKKGGKGLMIAVVAVILLGCCCSSSALFYFKWYKPYKLAHQGAK